MVSRSHFHGESCLEPNAALISSNIYVPAVHRFLPTVSRFKFQSSAKRCFQWRVHSYIKMKKTRAASEWWVCVWVEWTSVTWAEREGWKKRERGECCLWTYGRLPGFRVSFITLCFNYGCNGACANVRTCVCVSDCEPCVLSCVFPAYKVISRSVPDLIL